MAKNAIKTTPQDTMFIADKSNPEIKFKKGGKVKEELNDIIMYHEKEGNWVYPKNTIYAWLYDEPKVGDKLRSGEYDWVFFPMTSFYMALQKGYVPPLTQIWTAKYKKDKKGIEHLLGVVQAYLDEKENKLIILMMSVNPKHRRKGINSHIIKSIRTEFGIEQDKVEFDKPTDMGEKFLKAGKFFDGGNITE